jgi:dUTP pyrophosphatase
LFNKLLTFLSKNFFINSTFSFKVFFEKLSPNAKTPERGTLFSAGYDLFAANDINISSNNCGLVATDLAIKMPDGFFGKICDRSSVALNKKLSVKGGVIGMFNSIFQKKFLLNIFILDPDYRGNIGIILFNHNQVDYNVKKGEKVAQIIFQKFCRNTVLVEKDELEKTERGSKGFGSTDNQPTLSSDYKLKNFKLKKINKSYKNKEYKCMLCNKKFQSLDDINDHYQSHFNGY